MYACYIFYHIYAQDIDLFVIYWTDLDQFKLTGSCLVFVESVWFIDSPSGQFENQFQFFNYGNVNVVVVAAPWPRPDKPGFVCPG